jgi:hypothetical protein
MLKNHPKALKPTPANGKVTLTIAQYNALADRGNKAIMLVRDALSILTTINKTSKAGIDLLEAGLKGVGDPAPPANANVVPLIQN